MQDYDGRWFLVPQSMIREWYAWMDVDGEEGTLDYPTYARPVDPEMGSFIDWLDD